MNQVFETIIQRSFFSAWKQRLAQFRQDFNRFDSSATHQRCFSKSLGFLWRNPVRKNFDRYQDNVLLAFFQRKPNQTQNIKPKPKKLLQWNYH